MVSDSHFNFYDIDIGSPMTFAHKNLTRLFGSFVQQGHQTRISCFTSVINTKEKVKALCNYSVLVINKRDEKRFYIAREQQWCRAKHTKISKN